MVVPVRLTSKRIGKRSQREDVELPGKWQFLIRNVRTFVRKHN
jgi:hypothetical protein